MGPSQHYMHFDFNNSGSFALAFDYHDCSQHYGRYRDSILTVCALPAI